MQEFLELLFDLVTLKSSKRGPLVVLADIQDQQVRLTLENRGKRKLGFAAVQVHDDEGSGHFPRVDLAPRTALLPGAVVTLTIAASELRAQKCQRLTVLDTTGQAWPVEGLDATRLEA